MARQLIWEPGTTYKDWGLLPGRIRKGVTSDSISLKTPITKYHSESREELRPDQLPEDVFALNIGLLSAPMQAVTGPRMSVEAAKTGELGVIFCSQHIKDQAKMVEDVKGTKAGFVTPDVFSPRTLIAEIARHAIEKGYSTFPITKDGKPNGKLLGLLTGKDYSEQKHGHMMAYERMIPLRKLVAPHEDEIKGDLRKANDVLEESHHGAIPIIDKGGRLRYMVFRKDIQQHRENPLELVDDKKRYRTGAAINTKDYRRRVPALLDAGADILFIDSSQGFSDYQENTMLYLRRNFPDVPFIGGNIVTDEGFDFLVKNGAWGVKIGMGPGSICITRQTFRIGRAQATAVMKVAESRDQYFKVTGIYIPLIADGGIVTQDDIWIAYALGADAVMAGRFFAQFDESPPERRKEKVIVRGVTYETDAKPYWGEGHERAKRWMGRRYGQSRIPEGIEGWVPYGGRLNDPNGMPYILYAMREALAKGGYPNIVALHKNSVLEMESETSRAEGRPHDIGAPGMWSNYSVW